MYIKKSVLLCFCYKDFYSKENKLTELSCVRFSRGGAGAGASCPPRPGMEGGRGQAAHPGQGIFTPRGDVGGGGKLPRP